MDEAAERVGREEAQSPQDDEENDKPEPGRTSGSATPRCRPRRRELTSAPPAGGAPQISDDHPLELVYPRDRARLWVRGDLVSTAHRALLEPPEPPGCPRDATVRSSSPPWPRWRRPCSPPPSRPPPGRRPRPVRSRTTAPIRRLAEFSHTARVRTTVSIPDPVFADAERLAKRLKKSRSRLYADAIAEYVLRHAQDEVTRALDEACEGLSGSEDRFAVAAGRRILRRSKWSAPGARSGE